MRKKTFAILTLIVSVAGSTVQANDSIPAPREFLGHEVGADRKLVAYPKVLEYLTLVDEGSERVSIESPGTSTHGNPMPIVVLTSPRNQRRLERLREISRQLAKPDNSDPARVKPLIEEGATIALITCTIHSTEVGCTQMAMEFVHEFATTQQPERTAWMEDAVLLLMPSINPDGQLLIHDWYHQWVGTPYEGGRMPWLYHHYVGHDTNRDFYMLTQTETQVVNDVLYHRWFPQVFLDEHQMGSIGPRMFVPPQTDPLAPEVHSLIFRQADLLGTNMGRRLEEAGKRGVGNNMIYDSYWPGGTRNTAWWKNVTGLLTEVASVRIATPIRIEAGELRGGYKGLPEYKRRANYPSPWAGGWWRLRDIVEYELVATWAFLESCAENRRDILRNMHKMASEQLVAGREEPPYAFILPDRQHDPAAARKLVELLVRHGVEVRQAAGPIQVGYATYPDGTVMIPASQPYRPFLLTMLRPQRYPEVRPYVNGPIIPPYDVTSWSLPLSMGVEIVEAQQPVEGATRPLGEPFPPDVRVDPGAPGHLVSHAADQIYPLVNRLLADGKTLYWIDEPQGQAQRGDLFIPTGELPGSQLSDLARELGLTVRPATQPAGDSPWRISPARVGLFKPWRASMDEGWTRWLLEQYEFPHVNLDNEAIRSGAFTAEVDVLLFPDLDPGVIAAGRPQPQDGGRRRPFTPLPPPYDGGIDEWEQPAESKRKAKSPQPKGGKRIREWVESGGTVVALDSSADYFIDLFDLPVENVLKRVKRDRLDCPGSMLRILVDNDHPLGFGMRREEAAYFARSPAFRTRVPDGRFQRHVIARYPDDPKDVRVSGYLKGAELLSRRVAAVEIQVGQGRVVLIGFRAQHRAQPHRTFKLLFNALYETARG